jgi:hypothetical protein
MSYDVRNYRLGDDATAADRVTLRVWKLWMTWLRPILIVSVLMIIVSAVVGTTIAKSGGTANGFVAVWTPSNYAAAVPVTAGGDVVPSSTPWTRGIVAQLATVLAAALVAWPLLRRTLLARAVGAVSALVVVAAHLTVSHQWTLEPIVAAPASYQATALVSLWLLPVVTFALGSLEERRRRRRGASA